MGTDVLNGEEPLHPDKTGTQQPKQTKHDILATAAGNRADRLTGPQFRTEVGAAERAASAPRHKQLPPNR